VFRLIRCGLSWASGSPRRRSISSVHGPKDELPLPPRSKCFFAELASYPALEHSFCASFTWRNPGPHDEVPGVRHVAVRKNLELDFGGSSRPLSHASLRDRGVELLASQRSINLMRSRTHV